MNQSTKLSIQKGEGYEKTEKADRMQEVDPVKLDDLIDAAIAAWVEAHPEEMRRYGDSDCTWKLYGPSKVIYL